MINNITNGYANVLFKIGLKDQKLEQYSEWSQELLDLLLANAELGNILSNTSISKNERKELIKDFFPNDFDQTYIYFLWSIIDFNRSREITEILKQFLKLCQQHFNIQYVQVTSSYPLSENEIEALKKALHEGMGFSKITINNIVDPTLIGGLKLKTNSITIDDSIRNKLNRMKQSSFKLAQAGE